jgi:tRNA A-37 threonylcarbamoyl transferase component Bud32
VVVFTYPRRVADADRTMLARDEPSRVTAPTETNRCNLCGASYPPAFRVCPIDGSSLAAAGDSDDSMIGAALAGTFRVTKVLGEGGMGRVYEAEHVRLDRRYAVKVIHRDYAGRDDLLARFDRESRAMSRVQSDHVVDVVDVLRTPDGRPCIVVELLDGRDLEAYLEEKGKLSVREALALFRQMCRGLASAHAQGVVHRDLKPSNLFLSKDPGGGVTLKILDFGVAKVGGDDKLTGTGAIVGTPAYMSPEQARGASDLDQRTDVYAAGAVLYRMLTGQAPYVEGEGGNILIQVLEDAPPRPRSIEKSIPEGLEAVIEHAMAREQDQRFPTIVELEQAVLAFDSGGGTVLLDASRTGGATVAPGDAKAMTAKAKRIRPLAVFYSVFAAAGVGLAVGIALALLVDGLREGATIGSTDVVLVLIGGGVAFAAAMATLGRSLRTHWRSAPMIQSESERLALGIGAGLLSFGALELGARVWAIVALMHPGAWDPLWAGMRVIAAIGAGVIAMAWGGRKKKA